VFFIKPVCENIQAEIHANHQVEGEASDEMSYWDCRKVSVNDLHWFSVVKSETFLEPRAA
jgi:hypothetical protein